MVSCLHGDSCSRADGELSVILSDGAIPGRRVRPLRATDSSERAVHTRLTMRRRVEERVPPATGQVVRTREGNRMGATHRTRTGPIEPSS